MRHIIATSIFLLSGCASLALAAPAPAPAAAPKPSPTCKPVTLNFDDLGDSAGEAQPIPNQYEYHGFEIRGSQWGFVSKGDQQNGDWVDDDRPVPDDQTQHTLVTTHSGNNALMNNEDGFGRDIGGTKAGVGEYYFDLKSMWVRPEYPGAFDLRVECLSRITGYPNSNMTAKVPALSGGKFFKVVFPEKFKYAYRCTIGALNLQQVIFDDITSCQWYWDYSKYNSPPHGKL